nr:unnamed protein product [Callosobruchus analis]
MEMDFFGDNSTTDISKKKWKNWKLAKLERNWMKLKMRFMETCSSSSLSEETESANDGAMNIKSCRVDDVNYGQSQIKQSTLTHTIDFTARAQKKRSILIDAYPPSNCKSLKPPKLNAEIAEALEQGVIKQDTILNYLQTLLAASFSAISGLLEKMEVEELDCKQLWSKEQELCETRFLNTTTRDVDGRFIVRAPLEGGTFSLGNSKSAAESRLVNLERRLQKSDVLKTLR